MGRPVVHFELIEEQEVPGMGSFCLFTDPEGRMMGLWRSKSYE